MSGLYGWVFFVAKSVKLNLCTEIMGICHKMVRYHQKIHRLTLINKLPKTVIDMQTIASYLSVDLGLRMENYYIGGYLVFFFVHTHPSFS